MQQPLSTDGERLNKLLALEQGVSRREADNLITKGRVTINDTPAEIGARVAPGDTVSVDGIKLDRTTKFAYIAFNKPVGYVCSRREQGDNDTIYSILPPQYHHLKPVGRLDKNSSGLLILTNDGDFTYQMTHPKFHKTKEYEVTLDTDLAPLHQQMISDHGIHLEDGHSQLQLERLSDENRTDWKVLMHEGRNRQIRRTFKALGYEVMTLHRTKFGNYSVGQLSAGESAIVSP